MLYEIDGKYYVLAARKFRQVEVSKNGNDYDVKVVKNVEPIEYSKNINYKRISVSQAKTKKRNYEE